MTDCRGAAVQSNRPVLQFWDHFRLFLDRRIRYKITRAGLLFIFAILVVGFGAVISANNLMFLITSAMLATLLVSGLVSRLCLAALQLDFLVPEHVPAGRTVPGKLFVRNQKWFMPSFSIRVEGVRDPASPTLKSVYFPLIAGGATLEETVEVRFPKRGAYRQNSFAFSTSSPFGFLEKSARVTLRRETLIYPSIDPQPGFDDLLAGIAGEIETHYRGLGKDFYRIRPYEAFESARHVDWKASAHTGSPAGPRIRARAGADRGDIPGSRHPARARRLVRARHRLLRVPGVAPFQPGRGHPLSRSGFRFSAARGRRYLRDPEVPGPGLPTKRQ